MLRSLTKFRWKLTLSATLIAILSALSVMTVFMLFFSLRVQRGLRSDAVPGEVHAALARLGHELLPAVLESPPDLGALESRVAMQSWRDELWLRLGETFQTELGVPGVRLHVLALADPAGRVLVAWPESRFAAGTELSGALVAEPRAVLVGAMSGSGDAGDLAMRIETGDTVAAASLSDADGTRRLVIFAEAATAPMSAGEILERITSELIPALKVLAPFSLVMGLLLGLVTSRGLTRRLHRMGEAAAAWSGGDFSGRVRDSSGDELGELARRLNEMADQLGTLLETRQALAGLEERNHLARELHDTVKQQIFSVSMLLGTVDSLLEQDVPRGRETLTEAQELLQKTGRDLNTLILELRPAALDGKGLASALEGYCDAWSRQIGIAAHVRVQGDRALPLELEQGLFRVAQEALANVARHSRADRVEVHLQIDRVVSGDAPPADGPWLTLTVTDRGQGFDAAASRRDGFGLCTMRERVEKLAGRLEIRTRPGEGTRVVARCPLPGGPGHPPTVEQEAGR